MKLLPVMLAASLLAPQAALADSQRGYSNQCFREVYREEYVPGTRSNPGRVRRWTEKVEIPCSTTTTTTTTTHSTIDNNSCVEGSIIGGILGGGLGGVLSTNENWIWSIPVGVAGGSILGCQIDGG